MTGNNHPSTSAQKGGTGVADIGRKRLVPQRPGDAVADAGAVSWVPASAADYWGAHPECAPPGLAGSTLLLNARHTDPATFTLPDTPAYHELLMTVNCPRIPLSDCN